MMTESQYKVSIGGCDGATLAWWCVVMVQCEPKKQFL